MNQFSPYGIPNLQGATVEPPSFEPQIASLGQMIDTFTKRRIQMAQDDEKNQAAQAEVDRKMAWDKEKEAYGRRKQDIAEKKVDQESQYRRMTANQQEHKRAHGEIGAGRDPGTSIFFDEKTGEPIRAQWRYQGGQPPAAEAAPQQPQPSPGPAPQPVPAPEQPPQGQPVPTMMGKPVMPPAVGQGPGRLPPPVASASPDGQVQAPNDQELEALMARAQEPQEPQPQGSPNTVFLDENDEGTTRALTNNDTQHQELPIDAFPPGAHEGQRFNAEDVNLTGGKGNPFAEPVGMPPLHPEQGQQGPQSSTTFVPGQQIRGMSAQMPQPKVEQTASGKWVAVSEDGRIMGEVDPSQARAARAEENAQAMREVDLALAAGNLTPAEVQFWSTKKRGLTASMTPSELKMVYGQEGKESLQGTQIASNEGMQDKRLGAQQAMNTERVQGQQDLEKLKQEGKMALQRSKHKGGSGTFGGQKIVADGSEYIPIPQTRFGARPDMLMGRVDQEWGKFSQDEKLNTSLFTVRRLQLAKHNIEANGPNSGVLNMEAAFNFLGAVRGGVPVENETKKMLNERRTWGDSIHGLLARAGLGEAYERVIKGGSLTEEEANRARNVMSPQEQARIKEGIDESLLVATAQVQNQLKPFTDIVAQWGGPGGHIMRQHAVGLANSRLKTVGIEGDYNPFTDTKVGSESPFLKKDQGQVAQPQSQQGAAPAQPGAARPNAIDELAKQIKL